MDDGDGWLFSWRWSLFVMEDELLLSLKEDMEGHCWDHNEDGWVWRLEEGGYVFCKVVI